jgi:WD40 repeat protein
VRSVIFLPGTLRFLSAGSDGKILEWDSNDPDKKFQVFSNGKGIIRQIDVSPDGRHLVSVVERSGMNLYDLTSGSREPRLLQGGEKEVNSIAIGAESNILYATGSNNTVECWNLDKLNYVVIGTSTSTINSIAISPDGTILAGGTMDGRLTIWRTKSEGSSRTVFNDPKRSIYSVAYSPDGNWLAFGDLKGDIILLKASGFEQVSVLSGHTARINDIQFSPDSKTFASASYDGTVLFWEIADLTNPPVIMDDHSGLVFSVAFSPDGQYILSSSMDEDRLIRRPANTSLLSEKICSYVSRNFTTGEWSTYVGQDIPYEITCKVRKLEIGIKPDEKK